MTDLELFKAIVRATRDVAERDVSKAVAKVRALLTETAPEATHETSRKSASGKNRQYLGGFDRSGDDAA